MNSTNSRDAQWRQQLRDAMSAKERTAIPRAKMPELDPAYRITCNDEVNQGLDEAQAVTEATRCLDCPDPQCITGCPVGINIPGFIKNIQRRNFREAALVLKETSALPAVCGRVCPQERQCESRCIYLKMKKPAVAIGYLERFAADTQRLSGSDALPQCLPANGMRVAVVGSGPAGLSFAGDMIKLGYDVTVYEALHQIGGVLKYGIPEFRLPNAVVDVEIDALARMGVRFVKNCIIGKTLSYNDLLDLGYNGIFIASGAGLPRFMGIPGENLINILSSNEYLTRINLMGAGRSDSATPAPKGATVAIIGGGNTAMDSVRTARRMGASRAIIVYRRSEEEMPARLEEIKHAKEEGIEFLTLHNPVEYIGDEKGRVRRMRLQRMELGEPDASGRRSPVPVPGDIVDIDVDVVVVSVGVSPNPLIPEAFDGLDVTRRGTLVVDDTLLTTLPATYAGGDIVRGGATVILAMGDGRAAATSMHTTLT
ncbi:MAG: NADPH-dependent glutamate synthase, partial [Muribaculaceae bacterium]|nr:NADPH-dependent glutamate synthase [Muribaculaceae bacterium]